MPDVRLPDGTIVPNVPEGATRSQVLALVGQSPEPQKPQPSMAAVAGREIPSRMMDNAFNLPQILNAPLRPIRKLGESAAALATGNFNQFTPPPGYDPNAPNPLNLNTGYFRPDSPVNNLDTFGPSSLGAEHVLGGAQFLGEKAAQVDARNMGLPTPPTTTYQDAVQNQRQIREQNAEARPNTTMAAQTAGDVASLLAMRDPIARNRGLAQLNSKMSTQALQELPGMTYSQLMNNPTLHRALSETLTKSPALRTLANRTGRAAEAGIEGYLLGLMTDGDPVELASYAAGSQGAGSLILSGMNGLLKGGAGDVALKLGASAFAVGSLVQLLKEATPGGQNFILESMETGYSKVLWGLGLGLLTGAAGYGRAASPEKFVAAMPKFFDHLTAIPRTAVTSVIGEMTKDPSIGKVVTKLQADPMYFGPTAARRIQRAISNEDISLSETLSNLAGSEDFREKLDQL